MRCGGRAPAPTTAGYRRVPARPTAGGRDGAAASTLPTAWRAATDGEHALPRATPSRSPPPPRPPCASCHGWRPARLSAAAAASQPLPPVQLAVNPPAACVAGARPAGGGAFLPPFSSHRGTPSFPTTRDARAPPPASRTHRCQPCAPRAAGMALPWWFLAPTTSLGFAAASTAAAQSVASGALTGGGGGGGGDRGA